MDKRISLLDESEITPLMHAITPPLSALRVSNLPYNPIEHALFSPETFYDAQGTHVLIPPEFYAALDMLIGPFSDFYTYEQIRAVHTRYCLALKYDPQPSDASDAARNIVSALNNPLDSLMYPHATFFVPLSGVETSVPIPLGTATVVRPETAKEFVRVWCESRYLPPGMHTLPDVREIGGAFAQVDIGRATSERHDELLQRKTEDAINLLRFWMHSLASFQPFYNRPHIGETTPAVNAYGFGAAPANKYISTNLYLYSLGVNPISEGALRQMMGFGLADMIAWTGAQPGTARLAVTRVARELGHAWSHFNVEDRVMASFSALDGWLKGPTVRNDLGKTLGRRLGVLISAVSPTEQFAQQFYDLIYRPIRSAATHGEGLKPHALPWIDRIIVHLGITAVRNAIPVIRGEANSWAVEDFRQRLKTLTVA